MIIDRIYQVQHDVSPTSIRAFELSIGKQGGYLNMMKKRNSTPSADLIRKIVEKYPKYSLYWILGLSDDKFLEKNENILKEPEAVYKKESIVSDIGLIRKGQSVLIQQNQEILEKLNEMTS